MSAYYSPVLIVLAGIAVYLTAILSISEALMEKDWPRDTIGWFLAALAILAVVAFY